MALRISGTIVVDDSRNAVNLVSVNTSTLLTSGGINVSAAALNAYGQANSARDQANTGYGQANAAYDQANNARNQANTGYGQANTARDTANSAYGQANTATTNAGNAYGTANTAATNALNAYGQANTARDQANTARDTANNAYGSANLAYAQANTARSDANTTFATINTTFATLNTSAATQNTSIGNAYDQANTARNTANSAYGQANTATTNAGNAYNAANTAQTTAQNAYGQANTAYGQANAAYGQANSAYNAANNARVTVFANSGVANATTQNVNFINTSSILVTVANTSGNANVSLAVIGTPYDQANSARDQANTARTQANSAGNTARVFANSLSQQDAVALNFVNTATISVSVTAGSTGNANIAFTSSGGGGVTVTDDTTTNATRYILLTSATSGSQSTANVSSTKLYFNPSTGDLAATSFSSLSDVVAKTDIVGIENSLDILDKINAVEFKWKENGGKSYGVLAQEIEKILPELVNTNKDGQKTVSYIPLIAFLISAVKELAKEVKGK